MDNVLFPPEWKDAVYDEGNLLPVYMHGKGTQEDPCYFDEKLPNDDNDNNDDDDNYYYYIQQKWCCCLIMINLTHKSPMPVLFHGSWFVFDRVSLIAFF